MTSFADLEEDWVHLPTPVKAVPFRGFGRGGNGDRVIAWLRSYGNEVTVTGDNIVFDNGTDDGPITARPGDLFTRDPEDDNIHRIKAHRIAGLYRKAGR